MNEVKKRGRKPIEYNLAELTNVISRLEEGQKFASRDALYQAIEDTDYAMERKLKKAFIYSIIRKNDIPLKTPVGQKGRVKGTIVIKTGVTPIRRSSRVALPEIKEALLKRTPKEYHKLAEKVAAGSLKAIVKYNCLQCVSFQPKEVRNCGIKSCQSYSARPYKTESEKARIPLSTVVDTEQSSDILGLPDMGIEDSTNQFEAMYS